jgi:putative N6-adenine-specific DNA methylase
MTELYIAKTQFGLEDVLVEELQELGFSDITKLNRAVSFTADKRGMYKANLCLRSGLKILKPLYEFEAFTEHELYEGIKKYPWEDLIALDRTFAIQSVVNSEFFTHSKYAALKSKDAIVDGIREKKGSRPNVDPENPDILIHININMQRVSVSLDSSGEPLFKRGYRTHTVVAPLNETLAAGMIGLAGWKGDRPFYDGMCGSGTFLIEAALKAANVAPNYNRKNFGFSTWNDFDRKLLNDIKAELKAAEKTDIPPIVGADISNMAVAITQENIENAGFKGKIFVERKPFSKFIPAEDHRNGVLILNPPYGDRHCRALQIDRRPAQKTFCRLRSLDHFFRPGGH